MTSTNHPSVTVVTGPEAGAVLLIDEVLNRFAVGSDEGCHLVLGAFHISPMHAAFVLDEEGRVVVSDTKSLDGVYVNGTQISEHPLADGDEISIGSPDNPESPRLRFSAASGLPAFSPLPVEVESPTLIEPFPLDPQSEPSGEAIPSPEPFADLALSPAEEPALSQVEGPALSQAEAPLLSPFPESDPLPAPEPVPLEESAPLAAPAPPRPAAPTAARTARPAPAVSPGKPAQRRPEHGDADDPLAGLAESLGGSSGEGFVPPPAVVEPAPAPAPAKARTGAPTLLKVARVSVAAILILAVSWFAYEKYAESLAIAVIDTYVPNPVEPGQTLTINGSGFGSNPDPTIVTVKLGDVEAEVLDANPTRINIRVPESFGALGSQTLPLRVTALGKTSTGRQLKVHVTPRVATLSPRVALTGDEVTIAGQWLANQANQPKVLVAGTEAEVLQATPSNVRFKVPETAASEGQKVSVKVAVGADVSKEATLRFGRLPFLESVQPERALPGEVVTLGGLGLTGDDLNVTIGTRSAVVLSSSDAEIKVSVPGLRLSESAGSRDLRVQAGGRLSALNSLEVLRESAALYSPRFFVEVVEGGRASVSCELGPVMVLGPDPGSRKRAHDTAARLNALSTNGRTERVQFSAAETVINAPGGAVLTVGAEDGAGNPRSMASIWAAQLTDMFDLFLQGRRPGRTVELSPEGRVFVDIFGAARRRSSEPGVPQGLLYSPDPSWSRSLALLALNPTQGSGQALALLDGYWAGVIEVPGAIQPRKIEISLTATPSGLVGQRTSRQGRLSTDVTLQGLAYARRELRFSFTDAGETLNYAGRLDGDTIEGEVTRAAGGRVGKLALKLTR